MEKINKAYVGIVERWSTAHLTETPGEMTNITFKNGTLRDNPWPFAPHEECYLVKKSDLDAYMGRKEDLEKINCTPVWDAYNRLKAKVNELEAENADLKEKIKELGVIKSFLEVGNEKWIICNTELKSRNRNLELENAKLRGELSSADDELAKFHGEHTVEFLYEKHEVDKHIIGWTEVSGEEYELTFLTPERKIHE